MLILSNISTVFDVNEQNNAGEDVYAWKHLLHNMRGGTFLELGALDGVTYSNTYLLERYLNWTVIQCNFNAIACM